MIFTDKTSRQELQALIVYVDKLHTRYYELRTKALLERGEDRCRTEMEKVKDQMEETGIRVILKTTKKDYEFAMGKLARLGEFPAVPL